MQKLLEGIVKFKKNDFEAHKDLFTNLKENQNPHTLFITCCDSRIDPNRITGALPGEMFIIRNIANLVPPYRATNEYFATTSAIEYAVLALGVENIIVCGHSNCGGCAASLNPSEKLNQLPNTKKWLELTSPVTKLILNESDSLDDAAREWMMEQANIIEQLKHLMTYPYIHEKVINGSLMLDGWYYIIETGEIFIYNRKICEFELANA
ncbi:MAG: carbonic anhydrase [Herbinix sp.]|nr:carbonic anhydrase [Herbinix sp.]